MRLIPLCLLLSAAPLAAQQDQTTEADEDGGGRTSRSEQTLYDELLADYKNEYLSVGALIQAVADVRPDEDAQQGSQLLIAAARFRVSGVLDERFGYLLQANFASNTSLLDARISYRPTDAVRLAAGRYKAPFSAEFLTSAANIDFVNRSRVVRTLAPGRVVGTGLEVGEPAGIVTARAGLFNSFFVEAVDRVGTDDGGAQTGRFLAVGRLRARTPQAASNAATGLRLSAGANAVYEFPDGGPVEDGAAPPDRVLVGGDVRLRTGPFLVAGEVIAELVDGLDGFEGNRTGFYATLGLDVTDADRVLVRLDEFDGSNDLLLGYNTSFSQAAAGQLNVGIPLDDDGGPGRTRILVNVQLGF